MGATVVLDDASVEVVPGEDVLVPVTVVNTGTVIDAVTLTVAGLPEGWATVEPTELRLLPDRRGRAVVRLSPPRDATSTAGLLPLAVVATCREDRAGSAVEEAVLEVLPFSDVSAELLPRRQEARGLRTARYTIAVDNRGNAPVTVELDAVDPDQHLVLAVGQAGLDCPPGSASFGTLAVRGERRYWRGPPTDKPFIAIVRVPGGEPLLLDGALVQVGLLPMGVGRLLAKLLLLAALLVAAFLLVVKPQIVDATTETAERVATEEARTAAAAAAEEAVAPVAAQADDLAAQVQAASPAPTPKPTATPAPRPTATGPSAAQLRPRPFSVRVAVSPEDPSPVIRVGPEDELSLTGIVLQPNGDRGEVALLRSGRTLLTVRLSDEKTFVFPTALVFPPGSTLQFAVLCRNDAGDACDAAVLLTGTVRLVQGATPEPGVTAPAPAPQFVTPEPEAAPAADPATEPTPAPAPAG